MKTLLLIEPGAVLDATVPAWFAVPYHHICIYIYTHTHMYVYLYLYLSLSIYIYIYVHLYLYIYFIVPYRRPAEGVRQKGLQEQVTLKRLTGD